MHTYAHTCTNTHTHTHMHTHTCMHTHVRVHTDMHTRARTYTRAHTHTCTHAMSAVNVGDLGSIPGLGRSPGKGNGNPLQYSCLGNPMNGGAWWVTKSQTGLSDFTFTFLGRQQTIMCWGGVGWGGGGSFLSAKSNIKLQNFSSYSESSPLLTLSPTL